MIVTKGEFFLFCVGALAHKFDEGRERLSREKLAGVLQAASELPEESLGERPVALAALDFVEWHARGTNPNTMPKWLKAYSDDVADRAVIKVHAEHGDTWWAHAEQAWNESLAGRGTFLPRECHELLAGHAMEMVVRKATARQFKAWVDSVQGSEEEPFLFEGI